MSNLIRLYTQNNCPYCDIMKKKLDSWGMNYETINISEEAYASGREFLRSNGHRTVPQLYYRNVHLNKVDTVDFTKQIMFKEMMLAYDENENDSGVEMFG